MSPTLRSTLLRAPSQVPARVLLPFVLGIAAVLSLACGQARTAKTYYCPMHPTYTSDRPGSCPICNMDLVEKQAPDATSEPTSGPTSGHDHSGAASQVGQGSSPATPGERRILFYRNPMDATVTSPVPAKDGMGMDYVPVYSDEVEGGASGTGSPVEGHSAVSASIEGMRLAGVRTEVARREALVRTIRTVGSVVPDETRLYRAQSKISGWVEKLYVNFSGQYVKRGQPALAIYSPELLASQQEYLLARQNAGRFMGSTIPEVRRGGEDLVAAARRRLELFDVPASFIDELERTGQVRRTIDFLAPASGFVVSKEVLNGRQIEPGMELFTVVDLSHIWVEADFYESEARFLALGQEADLKLSYDPTTELTGRVAYIYPTLNPETRTLRVRFDLPNPEMKLKPGMFVDVEQRLDLGEGIVVPDSAVLDSGRQQIVFVEPEAGRFEPRLVVVGWRGDGKARLLSGVAEGEAVAVRANFLLDSESRLRAAIAGLSGGARP